MQGPEMPFSQNLNNKPGDLSRKRSVYKSEKEREQRMKSDSNPNS